jgi:hypothetical protein
MSTIRETVQDTLSYEGFASYADHTAAWATIKALEEREAAIVTKIRQFAAARTWRDDLVEDFLEGVGLAEPTPEPTPEPEHVMSVEERLDHLVGVTTTLTDMITRLVNAASRNGITV